MNVLIIQENGRHEKNRNYRECFSLKRAFEKHGHEALVWGLGHENYEEKIDYEKFDLIFNLENYAHTAGDWLPNLSRTMNPIKILWAIDAHCVGQEIFEMEKQRGRYDYLLHSTKEYVTRDYHIWFPNCFDDNLVKPNTEIYKKHKIGFCGNYVNRKPMLDWLRKTHGLKLDIFVIGDDMVKAINSYKAHFNMNMNWNKDSAINYRNFETIGCGTVLLTSHSSEYQHLGFEDGKNCLIYNNIKELEEKIKFIKNSDLTEIALAGLELSKEHTYDKRVSNLLKQLNL